MVRLATLASRCQCGGTKSPQFPWQPLRTQIDSFEKCQEMPFFGSKFSPKKAPLRKNSSNVSAEDLDDLVLGQRTVQLRLGNQELVFENGDWIPENGESGTAHKSNQKLRKKILELQEENNMLRLKYTVILNMLTQSTAESHLQEKELEKLRNKK